MRRSFHDKESDYHRRVLIVTPIAILLVSSLFIFSDVVPYDMIEKRFGWEGVTQILPEITIIPDNDPFEETRKTSKKRAMTALKIEEWEEKGKAPGAKRQEETQEKPEELVTPELDKEVVRHYPAHTSVPYSEDYVILNVVKPVYPPYELDNGIECDITVEILVNEGGRVEEVFILAATGPKSFEYATIVAARKFRFKPPVVDGEPMPLWIRFKIRFRILS
jgi:TonB family protein